MDMELGSPSVEKPSSIMEFLKVVMDLEKDVGKGSLGLVVVAVHAVFMDTGFVVCSGDGSRLPKDWNLATPGPGVSIPYTVPELLDQSAEMDMKVAMVRFSTLGNNVSVYGFLRGDTTRVYRLCLDLSVVTPLLECLSGSMAEEEEEKEVLELWKTVKKELSLPLLIGLCQKNELAPPPRFSHIATAVEKPNSLPYFLMRVMEMERDEIKGNLEFLVVSVHAVFLESGFVVCNGEGSQLPKDWNRENPTISVQYTVPDLLGQTGERDLKDVTLKFSTTRNIVSIYGFLNEGSHGVYRLCLDLSKVVPLLVFWSDSVEGEKEKEVFEFWKTVKDVLCLPLLIDICDKNGLQPPPCFARLPTDIKLKILELLPGDDVVRMGCTGSEMRYLSSNDELWKQKFMEEFGTVSERGAAIGTSWKEKYNLKKIAAKILSAQLENRLGYKRRYMLRYPPFVPRRFPFVGGDYDRFPAIGNLGAAGPAGLGLSARRNFSHYFRFCGGLHGDLLH